MDGDRLRSAANKNCYRLLHVSWAIAQISCLFHCQHVSPHVTENVSARRWSSRDSRECRELQGLGQRLGSCNVSSWSRLGLGSEGLVHISALDIWCIERYVCFWPLWFSKRTISSTVVTFSSVRVCFSLLVSCLWSVLHVSQISFNNILTLSPPKTVFLELVQLPYQSLVSTAKWHITSLVYRQCIKNYYLPQYHLLLFTNIKNECNTKRHSIFV